MIQETQHMPSHSPRNSPRSDYLMAESLRVAASPSLAHEHPSLKSMTVVLGYYDSQNLLCCSQITYKVNLAHAKSVFRFGCQNAECVQGDFDLSEVLAGAVADRRARVSGELCCQGWRSRTTINDIRCGKILRYTITLGY